MNSIHKLLVLLAITAGVASLVVSCKKEKNTGPPSIDYVRVTRPQSSDSLLVGAGQGQLIAIVGNNLQEAVEVWFNDQQARVTPPYITKTTLLVTVPTQIPRDVSNNLKIIFKNGYVLL